MNSDDRRIDVVARVLYEQRINCTGPGEVGCYAREGWHSWREHDRHVAESIVAELTADLDSSGEAS